MQVFNQYQRTRNNIKVYVQDDELADEADYEDNGLGVPDFFNPKALNKKEKIEFKEKLFEEKERIIKEELLEAAEYYKGDDTAKTSRINSVVKWLSQLD